MSRPKFHSTNLSDDSFIALLDALGLQNEGNRQGDDLKMCHYNSCLNISCKFSSEETSPQRHSFISVVDTDAALTMPLSASVNSRNHTRLRRPIKTTRPPALYLPHGLPTLNAGIGGSVRSLQSDPSTCKDSTPKNAFTTTDHSICIKAAFNATIIMLRTSRTISLAELKQRLYDKFVGQEGMRLSRHLTVVSVRPPASIRQAPRSASWATLSTPGLRSSHGVPFGRERSSLEPRRFSFTELTQMHFIEDEVDWQKILADHCSDGTKVTVRILDIPG